MATRRSEDESGPMPENGAAADGATAEQLCQSSPRARFRAAYEALIEPLVNATVKVAEAETEHQILRAQIGSFEAEVAALQAEMAALQAEMAKREAEIAALDARLASSQTEHAQLVEQLQAIYQSHSWRVTEPLRRAITLIRRLRRSYHKRSPAVASGPL